MKNHCYKVYFELNNRSEQVFAGCKADAHILAQAKQIKKGFRCDDLLSEKTHTLA